MSQSQFQAQFQPQSHSRPHSQHTLVPPPSPSEEDLSNPSNSGAVQLERLKEQQQQPHSGAANEKHARSSSPSTTATTNDNNNNNNASSSEDGGDTAEEQSEEQGEQQQPPFKLPFRSWLVFLTLCVLTLMVALDGTSISVALPIIASKLGGTAIEAFWSGTSFLLCSTVFQPTFASLSNIFGRKPIILMVIAFFLVGTIVAGVADDFTNMLVGRSIQGVGGGGIIALTEIVVTDLVPLRQRGAYFGLLMSMWSLGSVIGPILGGGFSQNVSWRWIFYINFPFIGFGVVFVLAFLKLNFAPTSLMDKLRRIDYVGTVLFVGSATSFLIPVTWGGVMHDWDSWRTLVPLIIGAVGLVGFAVHEALFAAEPMIPPSVFATRTALVSYVETVLHGLVLWCALYYMPLYFETVMEYTPILSGVALFPMTFTVAPSATVTGILVTLTGRYRWAIWLGFALSVLGLGIMYQLDVSTSIAQWIFLMLPAGIGLGILFPSLAFAIQASATPENMSIAVAMFSFFRAFGQALGVAIGGVIFQNRMRHNLLAHAAFAPYAEEYSRDAAALVQVVRAMADTGTEGAQKFLLKQAYAQSLQVVWAVCCGTMAVAGALSVLTRAYDMNRGIDSEQTIREGKTGKRNNAEKGETS